MGGFRCIVNFWRVCGFRCIGGFRCIVNFWCVCAFGRVSGLFSDLNLTRIETAATFYHRMHFGPSAYDGPAIFFIYLGVVIDPDSATANDPARLADGINFAAELDSGPRLSGCGRSRRRVGG
jgi:hypothetical protein